MTHQFHPEALDEFLAAIRFYTCANRAVGERFIEAIERVVEEIVSAPNRWRLVEKGVRRRVIRRFPYAVFYRIHEENVFFLAVAHCARRPGYWRSRLE